MNCRLNLKAPNGANSILFKDITEVTKNPVEAIDLYFYTKTPEFEDVYKGDKDANGEPIYAQFSEEAYLDEIDYNNIELDSAADVYKSVLSEIPKLINVIDDRIDFLYNTGGTTADINKLREIRKVLDTGAINSSIPKFIKMSKLHLFNLKNNAEKALNEPGTDIKKMASYFKVAQSYNSIRTIKNALIGDPNVAKIFQSPILDINRALGHIDDISAYYQEASLDYLADQFHQRDNTWTKKEIKQALIASPRDVLWSEMMLEYMGDSRDRALSMVARIMMEAEHKVRKLTIDFNKELETVLEDLEKAYPNKKGEAIFDELLIVDDKGETHFVDPDVEFTGGKSLFADKMYERLQQIKQSPALFNYLVFHSETMKSLESMLPPGARVGTRLPSVLRSEWELLQGKSIKEKSTLIMDNARKRITRSNTDMERGMILDGTGKPVRRIPTFYTQKYATDDYDIFYNDKFKELIKKGIDEDVASDQADVYAEAEAVKKMQKIITKDLSSSLQSFHAMALNYGAKNELVNIFDSAEFLIGNREYTLIDSGGRTMINPKTNLPVTKTGEGSNAQKQLKTFLDMQLYGQKEKDLGYFEVLGMKVDTNSSLRVLNNSTGLIMQAGNVLAGLGNISNGEYNNVMESIGGEFFTTKDYYKASGMYKKNITGILSDIGARTPSNIVNLLEEHYNILQSFGGDKISTNERSKARRLMKTNSLYFIQASGEHFMQVRAGLAMLNATEIFNKKGESLGNLLDAHKVENGKLIVPEDVYILEKDGSLVKFDSNQEARISNKIGAVLRKMHGNYSTKTANEMQQDARTALIMKFRGWMYEGIKRRWGKKRDYHMMESEAEGFYLEGARAAKILIKDLSKLQLSLTKERWSNMTPAEKANLRRVITEVSVILSLSAAGALLGKAGKLMEDEFGSDEGLDPYVLGSYQMLVYQVNRLFTEVSAYGNPKEAIKLMRTPMASSSILENSVRLIGQMGNPLEQYEGGWRKGQYKIAVRVENLVPLYKQIMTLNADGIKDRGTWLEQ